MRVSRPKYATSANDSSVGTMTSAEDKSIERLTPLIVRPCASKPPPFVQAATQPVARAVSRHHFSSRCVLLTLDGILPSGETDMPLPFS